MKTTGASSPNLISNSHILQNCLIVVGQQVTPAAPVSRYQVASPIRDFSDRPLDPDTIGSASASPKSRQTEHKQKNFLDGGDCQQWNGALSDASRKEILKRLIAQRHILVMHNAICYYPSVVARGLNRLPDHEWQLTYSPYQCSPSYLKIL